MTWVDVTFLGISLASLIGVLVTAYLVLIAKESEGMTETKGHAPLDGDVARRKGEQIRFKKETKAGEWKASGEVNIVFSAKAYKVLEAIACERRTSVTKVLEDAIGLERSYQTALREGGRLIIERKNGKQYQLVRR